MRRTRGRTQLAPIVRQSDCPSPPPPRRFILSVLIQNPPTLEGGGITAKGPYNFNRTYNRPSSLYIFGLLNTFRKEEL